MGDPDASGWAMREPEEFPGERKGAPEVLGSVHGAEWVLLGWVRAASGSADAAGRREGVFPGFLRSQMLIRNLSLWSDFLKQPPGQEM